jgi:hypothetical protein
VRDVILLALGAVAGVIATELFSVVKTRYLARRSRQDLLSWTERDDPRTHAANVVAILGGGAVEGSLYVTRSTADQHVLPVLPEGDGAFVGQLEPTSDWPLSVSREPRRELHVDQRVITESKKRGVELWDGTVLYATGWDESAGLLQVARCNYYAYVSFGEKVLRESDSTRGKKPYLRAVDRFGEALQSTQGPTVVAAATTCVFESDQGPVTVVHRRSSSVVNGRGMYAVTPVFGIEPHYSGTEKSRFGVVVYNVLKEILEELFGVAEIKLSNDRPHAPDPDWMFATEEGRRLVAELEEGRLSLFCSGACIDLTDGSLILAVTAHFRDPAFLARLKREARGSYEAGWFDGQQFEFLELTGSDLEARMSVDRMIGSSAYSLDRARLAFLPQPTHPAGSSPRHQPG